MRTKLKILIAVMAVLPIFGTATVFADSSNPLNAACQTNSLTRASAVCQQSQSQGTTNPIAGPNGVISKAANIIASIAGIAAVIMIIVSGFSYVTSAGNTESATKARQRILGAVIGLVIVALAWTIVRYVTDHIIK